MKYCKTSGVQLNKVTKPSAYRAMNLNPHMAIMKSKYCDRCVAAKKKKPLREGATLVGRTVLLTRWRNYEPFEAVVEKETDNYVLCKIPRLFGTIREWVRRSNTEIIE